MLEEVEVKFEEVVKYVDVIGVFVQFFGYIGIDMSKYLLDEELKFDIFNLKESVV